MRIALFIVILSVILSGDYLNAKTNYRYIHMIQTQFYECDQVCVEPHASTPELRAPPYKGK